VNTIFQVIDLTTGWADPLRRRLH